MILEENHGGYAMDPFMKFTQESSKAFFRGNSEINQEKKGGFIKARIQFRNIDEVDKIVIDMLSGDGLNPHGNLLYISSKTTRNFHFQMMSTSFPIFFFFLSSIFYDL